MIQKIKNIFRGVLRPAPPVSIVVNVPQPTPALPPLVDLSSPGVELCRAAWAQVVFAEDVYYDPAEFTKRDGIETEWAIKLGEGKAVVCLLFAYPDMGSGCLSPVFEYPNPGELNNGLQPFYAEWQSGRNPREETVDITIYRLDLGPNQVDPRSAFRVRLLGPESPVIKAMKKDRRRQR